MSDHRTTEPPVADVIEFPGAPPEEPPYDDPPPPKPKIRWLRLIALLTGLGVLAAVSTVFGMMMAVASDLPDIEVLDVAENPSKLYDRTGKVELGTLTGNERRILVRSDQIAPVMKHAIVSIEDRRFFTNSGVDLRGISRALYQDIRAQRAVQGGSTITQQLVKNRLDAQNDRTLFQKLREAAIAFHMTEKWDKQRILKNYLNTIYFGNGAYGIESAARTYFGYQYPGCGDGGQRMCAEQLEPHEAALLAGVVASPSGYDPVANPAAATERRNLVLLRMFEQGYISRLQYERSIDESIPARLDIRPPAEESRFPYFTTWVRQQVVDQMGTGAAFEGGLRVTTTIDARMQEAAEAAVGQLTQYGGPSAALVAIENKSSEVVAMVGGDDEKFNERPFNLATQGQRQPGSAFKPFTLIEALERKKASPTRTFTSKKRFFCVTRSKSGKCREWFEVNNYEDNYAGVTSLANATAHSDNSVYAALGIEVGTKRIARLANRMGIRTELSTNLAITLGGLEQGVTVLDMARAYQTLQQNGKLVYGTLSPDSDEDDDVVPGPVGVREIRKCREGGGREGNCRTEEAETLDGEKAVNRRRKDDVFSYKTAQAAKGMLAGVVKFGTGKRAALGPKINVFGKTGTTEDYGDAWFVGFTDHYTVAVWVGFPDAVKPMKPPLFAFEGEPVAGGTWPTVIWQSFMKAALDIYKSRLPKKEREKLETGPTGATGPSTAAPAPTGTATAPEEDDGGGGGGGTGGTQPQREQPEEVAPPEPQPETAEPNATVAPEQQAPPAEAGGTAPPET